MQGLQLDKEERKCGNERENRIECSTMSHFFGEWNGIKEELLPRLMDVLRSLENRYQNPLTKRSANRD